MNRKNYHSHRMDTKKEDEVQEPKKPCDATLQSNMSRYAERYSTNSLQLLVRTTEIAGYTNFDPVKNPDGEVI